MFITLCYLYLWARWGRRPAALVRATVQRLRASRCSFAFCAAAARPRDARVCLSRGGRVFCVGESQVRGRGPGAPRGGAGAGRTRVGGAASGSPKPEARAGTPGMGPAAAGVGARERQARGLPCPQCPRGPG